MSLSSSLPEMPCGPILELKGQRKRFHVPFGLKPLIEEMSMRVLQDQPENIYEYLACFMEARVQTKDDKLSKRDSKRSSEGSAPPEDDLSDFIKTIRTSVDEADHYATVIQTAFRGHMAKKLVNNLRKSMEVQNHHATVIQAAFRGHLAREKVKVLRHSMDSGEYDDEEEGEGASEYGADDSETEGENDEYYDDEEYYDSEEEMETEVEISEMDELAEEEVEILTVKSPPNLSKYAVSKTDVGGHQEDNEEDEE